MPDRAPRRCGLIMADDPGFVRQGGFEASADLGLQGAAVLFPDDRQDRLEALGEPQPDNDGGFGALLGSALAALPDSVGAALGSARLPLGWHPVIHQTIHTNSAIASMTIRIAKGPSLKRGVSKLLTALSPPRALLRGPRCAAE